MTDSAGRAAVIGSAWRWTTFQLPASRTKIVVTRIATGVSSSLPPTLADTSLPRPWHRCDLRPFGHANSPAHLYAEPGRLRRGWRNSLSRLVPSVPERLPVESPQQKADDEQHGLIERPWDR
jgi:hypothetical protein